MTLRETTLIEYMTKTEKETKTQVKTQEERETETIPITPPQTETPRNLPDSYLVSVGYDGSSGRAYLKLYEPRSQRIYIWYDDTGHKPYCLTDLTPEELKQLPQLMAHPGLEGFEVVEKYDSLRDRTVRLTKVIAKDPLAIGGRRGAIRELIPREAQDVLGKQARVWEAAIRYHHCYIFDRNLAPGMLYRIVDGKLVQSEVVPKERLEEIRKLMAGEPEEYLKYVEMWAKLLESPAPEFRRVALDIEVFTPVATRVPNAREAEHPIIAVALVPSDGESRVLLLRRQGMKEGDEPLPEGVKLEYYDSEHELLKAVFRVLREYPFVITFNGDNFDLCYIWHRALKLGFKREEIPIRAGKDTYLLSYGIHIDLYKLFHNRALQIYAFKAKYDSVSLGELGSALLGLPKLELEKPISELNYRTLAKYCYRDAEITLKLTKFEDNLVMKLILALSRISRMPMEDVSRQSVSQWIRGFIFHELRRRNTLIPNSDEIVSLKGETATKAIVKGKYMGAIVVDPTPGVHMKVLVLDFSSLYPSAIKRWNLSYETVRCPHPECKENLVPGVPHWVCKKRRGVISLLIGSLRDLRVKWYKPKSKDKSLPDEVRGWYNVIQSSLKVILNASYGVFGTEIFDLYCPPMAESTAAIGRDAILKTIKKSKELGIQVIYGDTDSVFLKNPTQEQVETLIKWSEEELGMDLDVDKVYRYVVFSTRKKNYLGVMEDGSVDIKGLTGKKKHMPLFIKEAFLEVIRELSNVNTPEEFEDAKRKIKAIIRERYLRLKKRDFTVEELAFHVTLGKAVESYTKTTPQHVKAAELLKRMNIEVKAGDLISFVKVVKPPHVKPVQLATKDEVDVDKYVGYLESTFSQILDALGLDFDEILGTTRLELFMQP